MRHQKRGTRRAFFFLYGSPLAVRHVETLPHGAQSAAGISSLNVKFSWNPFSDRP
jgi:hypothetical protein